MKKNSTFSVKVCDKIEQIDLLEWKSVFPDVLENYFFFKSIDESGFDQFSFRYIMVYESGVAVGATSCFFMRFPFDMTVQGPLKIILDLIKKLFPDLLSPKVLMCGLPMGAGRIGFAQGKNSEFILETILGTLESLAKDGGASQLIFKDFTGEYDGVLRPLLKKGFVKIQSLPSTDMKLRFSDFDEYLKTLSRVSRDGFKRKFKQVDGKVPIDLEIMSVLDEAVLSEVYALYLQTYHKLDMGMEKVPEDFFRNISRNMPDEVKYFLWRIEGKLAAFAFCLVSGKDFIDYYLGFDYAVAYTYNLYLIRFRDLMRWCIANGITRYEMGVTNYEPKRRMGFDFIKLHFYMKHCNKLFNPFFKIGTHFMKPENFEPVFKDMKKKEAEKLSFLS